MDKIQLIKPKEKKKELVITEKKDAKRPQKQVKKAKSKDFDKNYTIEVTDKGVLEPEIVNDSEEDNFLTDENIVLDDIDIDPTEILDLSTIEDLTSDSKEEFQPSDSTNIFDVVLNEETSNEKFPVALTKPRGSKDPLAIYLSELRKYPILTKEEEHELAVRFYKNKDKEALFKLITGNLWLAVKIARDYERAAKNLMDLIQEGNMGLLEAVKNFDPYRDVRLPSYAVWWIKAYIIRYLINNWRMVKIGTTQAQRKLFFNLKKERDKLEKEGFIPSAKLIADRLNVKESEVVEMEQRMGSSDMSVDAPITNDNSEGESNLLSLIPIEQSDAHELLEKREFYQVLQKSLLEFREQLNEKEKAIFEDRLLHEEKATLHDLSVKLSISKERVRQLEERIKLKLKAFMLENFKGLVDEL